MDPLPTNHDIKEEPFDPSYDENSYDNDILDENELLTHDEDAFEDIDIDLSNVPQYAIEGVSKETLERYKNSWRDFLIFANIRDGNEPTKEDFDSYFKHKREQGKSYSTARALYSHLNKMFKMIHNKEIDNFSGCSLKHMLERWQPDPIKSDRRLTKAQIIQFLKEADDSDRYLLVRKVIAMVAFLGGVKLSMLRKMTLGSVKPHPKGYAVHIHQDMTVSSSKAFTQHTDEPVL